MFAKLSLLCVALCCCGIRGAPQYFAASSYPSIQSPTLSATQDNVYRSPGNLASISTHSKSIATPFSSSNKQVTSITNPGVYAAAPLAATYHAPAQAHYAYAPVPAAVPAAAVPLAGATLLGTRFSPSVDVSHMTFTGPLVSYAY